MNPLAKDHKFMVRGREMSVIDRGRESFDIYCSICHGYSGQGGNGKQGHGLVGRKWDVAIPNFHVSTKDGADNRFRRSLPLPAGVVRATAGDCWPLFTMWGTRRAGSGGSQRTRSCIGSCNPSGLRRKNS